MFHQKTAKKLFNFFEHLTFRTTFVITVIMRLHKEKRYHLVSDKKGRKNQKRQQLGKESFLFSLTLYTIFFIFQSNSFFFVLNKATIDTWSATQFQSEFFASLFETDFVFSKGFLNEQKQRVKVMMGNCRKRKLLGRKKMRKFETDFYRIRFNSINHHIIVWWVIIYLNQTIQFLIYFQFKLI